MSELYKRCYPIKVKYKRLIDCCFCYCYDKCTKYQKVHKTSISRIKCQHERNLESDIYCLLSQHWITKNICKNVCTNYKKKKEKN